MTYDVACHYCGEPVDAQAKSTYRGVHGWEHIAGVRSSGKHGGSDITHRQQLEEWAHPACVDRAKAGISPAQETLV